MEPHAARVRATVPRARDLTRNPERTGAQAMATVQDQPPDANDPPAHVNLADPAARAQWLTALREETADAIAAGLDATARPSRRVIGRHEARRQIEDAARAIGTLFAAAGDTVAGGVP